MTETKWNSAIIAIYTCAFPMSKCLLWKNNKTLYWLSFEGLLNKNWQVLQPLHIQGLNL